MLIAKILVMRLAINPYDKILCYTSEGFFVKEVGIAQLCPTSGTRTQFNQDFGTGLILRPFLQNVYYPRPFEGNFRGFLRLATLDSPFLATTEA